VIDAEPAEGNYAQTTAVVPTLSAKNAEKMGRPAEPTELYANEDTHPESLGRRK
jgi:hypothetical protein